MWIVGHLVTILDGDWPEVQHSYTLKPRKPLQSIFDLQETWSHVTKRPRSGSNKHAQKNKFGTGLILLNILASCSRPLSCCPHHYREEARRLRCGQLLFIGLQELASTPLKTIHIVFCRPNDPVFQSIKERKYKRRSVGFFFSLLP